MFNNFGQFIGHFGVLVTRISKEWFRQSQYDELEMAVTNQQPKPSLLVEEEQDSIRVSYGSDVVLLERLRSTSSWTAYFMSNDNSRMKVSKPIAGKENAIKWAKTFLKA